MRTLSTYVDDKPKGSRRFRKFYKTLPENLQYSEDYDLVGYWKSLGKPEEFDYSQPKDADGKYHGTSRDPKTGRILKAKDHETFTLALDTDKSMGYNAYTDSKGNIYTLKNGEDKIPKHYKSYDYTKDKEVPVKAYQQGGVFDAPTAEEVNLARARKFYLENKPSDNVSARNKKINEYLRTGNWPSKPEKSKEIKELEDKKKQRIEGYLKAGTPKK